MKKKLILTLALCSFLATNKVKAQPINTSFKDDNFYACIIDNYNSENATTKDSTYNLTQPDLDTIEHLSCSGKQITDITGIEKLQSLQTIDLSDNELTSLATLQSNTNSIIEKLDISKNHIKNLYMSRLTNLNELDISNNEMETFVLANYIPTLKLDGNNFMKNIQLSLKNNDKVNINDYLLFDNIGATTDRITVEYNIQDETIAENNSEKITAKKVGTTAAQLIIKNGNEIIYAPTIVGEFPTNSTINVTDVCMPILTGARRYTVKLETNGGTELEDISEAFNFSINLKDVKIELPTPTKKGYKFVGWYTDKDFSKEAKISTYEDITQLENTNEDECSNEIIVKIYAKWEENIENPKTGIKTSLILDGGIILISAIAYIIITKKNKYNKI